VRDVTDIAQQQHLRPGPPGGGVRALTRRAAPAARAALSTVWDELVRQAFTVRPLPRLPAGTRLPWWLPHALLAAMALAMVPGIVAQSDADWRSDLWLAGLGALPLLTAVHRPVLALWTSLLVSLYLGMMLTEWYDSYPWIGVTFVSHLVVLTLAAVHLGPASAVVVWGVNVAGGAYAYSVQTTRTSSVPDMALASLVVLSTVLLARGWLRSRHQVVEQTAVTARERSARTLLEERATIARELHDVVAHHMSVVAIQAEAAPYRVEHTPPELARAFATIRENAVAALAELRRVLGVIRAADLAPPDAPQPTLAELDGLLANVRDAGLEVTKTVTGAVRELPQGVELSAYRVVQEALSNALRHAPGSRVAVELSYVPVGLGLRVVNGPPDEPVEPSPGAGHGLIGMRERVAVLNGWLTAGPAADGGFAVDVFLPVPPCEEGGA
jgi:signal transduction histidine kinase